ncbi:MAG: aquaporin [Gemmataceae bacterium]|nr:aquaporin [Gemmataceae bacterium]MDW8265678.1 aquaporin [Gemmataceae bacterium]
MQPYLRACLAEFLGTLAVVFVGAGTVCAGYQAIVAGQTSQPNLIAVALAHGLMLAAALAFTQHQSGGYLNPAISLTLWVLNRLDGWQAARLIAAQLAGAGLGGLGVRLLFTEDVLREARLGTPHLNLPAFGGADSHLPTFGMLLSGIGVEFMLTWIVTLAVFGTGIDPRGPRLNGLAAGPAWGAGIFFAYFLTGAATNPARWFGTVIWEKSVPGLQTTAFADHAVYWIGPVLGALAAGCVYSYGLMSATEPRPSASPDKPSS